MGANEYFGMNFVAHLFVWSAIQTKGSVSHDMIFMIHFLSLFHLTFMNIFAGWDNFGRFCGTFPLLIQSMISRLTIIEY